MVLAATDPANPYGTVVKWPLDSARGRATSAEAPTRSVGARVILVDGFAAAHLRRGERELILFAPEAEPRRSRTIRQVALALLELAAGREQGHQGMLITEINGEPASTHPAADLFAAEGFATTAMGLQARIQGLRAKAEGPSAERSAEGPSAEQSNGSG